MGCGSTNEEKNQKSDDFFYCFTKEEISLIQQIKAKKQEDDFGGEEPKKEEISLIYQKIKIDLKKKEKAITEYLVLYLPNSFPSQLNTTQFDYLSNVSNMVLEFKGNSNIIKYSKKMAKKK